jgi:hypothetical protein
MKILLEIWRPVWRHGETLEVLLKKIKYNRDMIFENYLILGHFHVCLLILNLCLPM